MATVRSDLIIPEVFTPYLIEATTQTDSFLQSGVVQPLAELNLSAERGGDFVKIPSYSANLSGDFEVLTGGNTFCCSPPYPFKGILTSPKRFIRVKPFIGWIVYGIYTIAVFP